MHFCILQQWLLLIVLVAVNNLNWNCYFKDSLRKLCDIWYENRDSRSCWLYLNSGFLALSRKYIKLSVSARQCKLLLGCNDIWYEVFFFMMKTSCPQIWSIITEIEHHMDHNANSYQWRSYIENFCMLLFVAEKPSLMLFVVMVTILSW